MSMGNYWFRSREAPTVVCRRCGQQRSGAPDSVEAWFQCVVCQRTYCPACVPQLPQPPPLDAERLCPHCSGFAKKVEGLPRFP